MIVGDPNNGFSGQHDVRSLGDGTITLYDNATRTLMLPRAVRYRIDEAAGTATLVEQVTNSQITSSVCCGSARKLPGGNWVTGWGGQPVTTEQTAAGGTVFRPSFESGLFSYRTQPVASGVNAGELRAGMDAQYPRTVIPEVEPDPVVPSPPDAIVPSLSNGAGSPKASSDSTPPSFQVTAKTVQKILKQRGLLIEVGCPAEACTARARGTFSLSGAAKVFKLRTAKAKLSEGASTKLCAGDRQRGDHAIPRDQRHLSRPDLAGAARSSFTALRDT